MEKSLLFTSQVAIKVNYNEHLSGILQFAKYFPICFSPWDKSLKMVYLFSHIADEETSLEGIKNITHLVSKAKSELKACLPNTN